MRNELDALLCSRYRSIFRDRNADMQTTCMCWGFSCGDGWFSLLDALCSEIQCHADRASLEVVAVQVKEKFGTLRFYVNGGDDFVNGLVWTAEAISDSLCEECGAPGYLSGSGWFRTRCVEHGGVGPKPDAQRQLMKGAVRLKSAGPEVVFPPIWNPGWRHLAERLQETLEHDMRRNDLPAVVIDAVIETETLAFRWHGGDDKGRVAGFFALIEALSLRTDPVTGKPK